MEKLWMTQETLERHLRTSDYRSILLVIEMTNNYHLILPLIITTLGATMLAQVLGGQPIYSQLLRRKMEKEKIAQREQSDVVNT